MAPIVPFIPLIAAGAGLISTGISLFSGSKSSGGGSSINYQMPAAQEVIPTPTENTAEVQEAKRRKLISLNNEQGRGSTLLTGGQGLQETAPVARKELFGEA